MCSHDDGPKVQPNKKVSEIEGRRENNMRIKILLFLKNPHPRIFPPLLSRDSGRE